MEPSLHTLPEDQQLKTSYGNSGQKELTHTGGTQTDGYPPNIVQHLIQSPFWLTWKVDSVINAVYFLHAMCLLIDWVSRTITLSLMDSVRLEDVQGVLYRAQCRLGDQHPSENS